MFKDSASHAWLDDQWLSKLPAVQMTSSRPLLELQTCFAPALRSVQM